MNSIGFRYKIKSNLQNFNTFVLLNYHFYQQAKRVIQKSDLLVDEVQKKLERYCAYQERCHAEVNEKLQSFALSRQEKDQIIVGLIQSGFLNEERFANLFALSKFHQKKWGKTRIKNELKLRNLSDYLINKALQQITWQDYQDTFDRLAEKEWAQITEKNHLKRRKKFCDSLLRKGWESDKIYERVKELEAQ